MKQFTLILPALCLAAACQQKPTEQAKTQTDSLPVITAAKPPAFTYGDTSLLVYDQYLNTLDSTQLDNVEVALRQFKTSFANKPAAVCDTALFLFDHFQRKVLATEPVPSEKLDSITMLTAEEGTKPVLTKELKAVQEKLDRNGIAIEVEEGASYPTQSMAYLMKHFSSYVSPTMKQYLAQMQKDQEEGLEEDAGLTISPQILASRTAWWEAFNRANPKFIYEEADLSEKILLYSLLKGTDNTPLMANDSLDTYFRTAYEYLRDSVLEAEVSKVVVNCLNAYDKGDTATAHKLANSYQKQHDIQ